MGGWKRYSLISSKAFWHSLFNVWGSFFLRSLKIGSQVKVSLVMNQLMYCSRPKNPLISFSLLGGGISNMAMILDESTSIPLSLTKNVMSQLLKYIYIYIFHGQIFGTTCAPPHISQISPLLFDWPTLFILLCFFSFLSTHTLLSQTPSLYHWVPLHITISTIIFPARSLEKLRRNLCIFISFIWGKNFLIFWWISICLLEVILI